MSNVAQWIGLGAIGLGLGAWFRKKSTDADWLARLLVVEAGSSSMLKRVQAGDAASIAELTGIAWVARNRAKHHGKPIQWVATTQERGKLWNQGSNWIANLDAAPSKKAYPTYLKLARRVMLGLVPNPIGERMLFVHTDTQTRLGRRMPSWIVSRSKGGKAPHEPMRLGRATFA